MIGAHSVDVLGYQVEFSPVVLPWSGRKGWQAIVGGRCVARVQTLSACRSNAEFVLRRGAAGLALCPEVEP